MYDFLFILKQQLRMFANIGSSDVITDINVSIDMVDVMDGGSVMMEVMNGIVVRYSTPMM
jgi:hypothetical protein